MKKILVVLMLAVLMMSAVSAVAEPLLGGWQTAENTEVTEEQKAVFDKAMEGLVGVNYEPVAYLASQVVAGANHCFLCKATVVYPNAAPGFKLVFVYQDLQGNATITNIADLDIAALSTPPVQE